MRVYVGVLVCVCARVCVCVCVCVHVCVTVCVCVCVQLLCKSVQHSDVLQTMQLVFSGADVCYLLSCLYCSWTEN